MEVYDRQSWSILLHQPISPEQYRLRGICEIAWPAGGGPLRSDHWRQADGHLQCASAHAAQRVVALSWRKTHPWRSRRSSPPGGRIWQLPRVARRAHGIGPQPRQGFRRGTSTHDRRRRLQYSRPRLHLPPFRRRNDGCLRALGPRMGTHVSRFDPTIPSHFYGPWLRIDCTSLPGGDGTFRSAVPSRAGNPNTKAVLARFEPIPMH